MPASSKYKLIIGLGNPGEEYANTYHNAGLLFVNYLEERLGLASRGVAKIEGRDIFHFVKTQITILIKPDSFMNESGSRVIEALKRYKINANEILVAHDDSDLKIGSYKISKGGGSAGHKGIESVIKFLDTNDFSRLRLGIRKTIEGDKRPKAEEFVLKQIGKTDLLLLKEAFERAEQEIIS